MREEPLFRKCCRCVPLRVCLHIWAWFKFVADITVSLYLIIGFLMFYYKHQYDSIAQFSYDLLFMIVLIAVIVDFVFVTILIAGIFRKNYTALSLFFYYGIFMILAETTIMSTFFFLSLSKSPPRRWDWLAMCYVIFVLLGVFWILIDISIILTLKSEMIKIRNKEQYDFARMSPNTRAEDDVTEKIVFEGDHTEKCGNAEEKYLKLLD